MINKTAAGAAVLRRQQKTKGASAYGGMQNGMEEKRVCSYCGTVFDGTMERCPLCGSRSSTVSEAAPEEEVQQHPVRRTGSGGGGKYAAPRRGSRKKTEQSDEKRGNRMLLAAVIILAIAVLLVLYFIGDMIGWWPGFENLLQRETLDPMASDTQQGACTSMELSARTLSFAAAGDSRELTVSVNLDCTEELSIVAERTGLVQIVPKTDKPVEGVESKSMTYIITAVTAGQTRLSLTCGEQQAVCEIDCDFEGETEGTEPPDSSEQTEPSDSSEPTESSDPDFEPQLNYADVSMFSAGESFTLKVTNLPAGAEVTWSSQDEDVAKVDENGKVTAVGGGTTYITAEVKGNTARMVVRCNFESSSDGDSGASLNYTDVTIAVGETFYLRLYDANDERITEGLSYSIDDTAVATLDDNGVTGVSAGTTTVTVTYNGEEYTCIVRVRG